MCGVLGITGHPQAKAILPTVMLSLQHRGHDSAGVAGFVSLEPTCIETHKKLGKISQVINHASMERFTGNTFIAHTRYSTRNEPASARQIHPHWAQSIYGRMVIVTNGDIINLPQLLEEIKANGVKVYTENDAEIIAALINIEVRQRNQTMINAIKRVIQKVKGGYAALLMHEDDNRLFAFRDPWGIRPLHLGEFAINGDKCVAVASETCAFDVIRRYNMAKYPDHKVSHTHREVQPGEVLAISDNAEIHSEYYEGAKKQAIGCVFETIYFARPDSLLKGESFQVIRERMGAELFRESPATADIVTAVPKGGIPAAVGFARAAGLPYDIAILEEPSTGGIRSFITNHEERQAFATMKYNVLGDVVRGKSVVVVDDSIVRGTTARLLVRYLFEAGATQVHLRIPCPPYNNPCHYGIETRDPSTLISHGKTNQEICDELGATSLAYLSIPGLYRALKHDATKFCDECLSARSPIEAI